MDATEMWAVIKTNFIAKELGEAFRFDYESAIPVGNGN